MDSKDIGWSIRSGLGRIHAGLYDMASVAFDRLGMSRQRRRVGAAATGRVLEIGVGTGRNLRYYAAAANVVGIDPDIEMLQRAERAVHGAPVELVEAHAGDLPFEDDTFDSAVVSLTLCTIPNPLDALQEARRVLKPDGSLIFLEHVLSATDWVAGLQRMATPAWRLVAGGCHLDRSTVEVIESCGFDVTRLWRSGDGSGSIVQGTARPREHTQ